MKVINLRAYKYTHVAARATSQMNPQTNPNKDASLVPAGVHVDSEFPDEHAALPIKAHVLFFFFSQKQSI